MFVLTCLSLLSSLSQVNQFRQLYAKVINDKHDDVMAKFGAILAQGVLDAGPPLRITPPLRHYHYNTTTALPLHHCALPTALNSPTGRVFPSHSDTGLI